MKIFTIQYYFEGSGSVDVKAKSEKEATDKFYYGKWHGKEEETGTNYEIHKVEETHPMKKHKEEEDQGEYHNMSEKPDMMDDDCDIEGNFIN